jgi:hypothetical protein
MKIFRVSAYMKKLLFIFLPFLFIGCASQMPALRNVVTISEPQINKVETQELGNTLVKFYIATTMPSIEVVQNWSIYSDQFDMPPQILIPITRSETFSKFSIAMFPPNASIQRRNICFDATDSTFFSVDGLDLCNSITKALLHSGPISVRPADYIDVSQPFFRQELIFNGRVNTSLKFMYREFSGSYMRAPFTQEIQYDLSEGNVIGFKGLRLEVLESTNRNITYRVLKMFDRQ